MIVTDQQHILNLASAYLRRDQPTAEGAVELLSEIDRRVLRLVPFAAEAAPLLPESARRRCEFGFERIETYQAFVATELVNGYDAEIAARVAAKVTEKPPLYERPKERVAKAVLNEVVELEDAMEACCLAITSVPPKGNLDRVLGHLKLIGAGTEGVAAALGGCTASGTPRPPEPEHEPPDRAKVIAQTAAGAMLQRKAAELLGLTTRRVKQLVREYRATQGG